MGKQTKPQPEQERRYLPAAELRAVEQDGKRTLVGYAARFNERSEWLGYFYEVIAPGAFRTVLGNDVRALFNHDPAYVLGRTANGTLVLEEDELGLRYTITLPQTRTADEVWTLIQRGDVSQSSFAFETLPDGEEWSQDTDGTVLRRVTKVSRLHDVSPVTYPAYPATSVHARDMAAALAAGEAPTEQGTETEIDAPTRVDDTTGEGEAALLTQAAERTRHLRLLALRR